MCARNWSLATRVCQLVCCRDCLRHLFCRPEPCNHERHLLFWECLRPPALLCALLFRMVWHRGWTKQSGTVASRTKSQPLGDSCTSPRHDRDPVFTNNRLVGAVLRSLHSALAPVPPVRLPCRDACAGRFCLSETVPAGSPTHAFATDHRPQLPEPAAAP